MARKHDPWDVALRADIVGTCGKCRVILEEGRVEESENVKLTADERAQGYVLACHCQVQSDLTIRVPLESQVGDRRVLDRTAAAPTYGATLSAHDWEQRLPPWSLDPPAQKIFVSPPPPTLEDTASDATVRRHLHQHENRKYECHPREGLGAEETDEVGLHDADKSLYHEDHDRRPRQAEHR